MQVASNESLCEVCKTIFQGGGTRYVGVSSSDIEFYHHTSYQALRCAVAHRCPLCVIVSHKLRRSLENLAKKHSICSDVALPLPLSIDGPDATERTIESSASVDASSQQSSSNSRLQRYVPPLEGDISQQYDILEMGWGSMIYARVPPTGLSFYFQPSEKFVAFAGDWCSFHFEVVEHKHLQAFDRPDALIQATWPPLVNHLSSSSTGDTVALAIARHWLENCLQNHQSTCGLLSSQGRPPTRLLLVEKSPNLVGRVVKLIETDSAGVAHYEYMTLSHRWGDPTKMYKLTSNNYSQLLAGVAITQLPVDFQQAFEFVEYCGLRYLWIDSLCIRQDDTEDWNEIARTMGGIYHDAVCNISAAVASMASRSLYSNRKLEDTTILEVKVMPGLWSDEKTSLGNHYVYYNTRLWGRSVDDAPINLRGWVMQERLLSPRKVYFADEQLFWECRRIQASESFPYRFPTQSHEHNPLVREAFGTEVAYLVDVAMRQKLSSDGADDKTLSDFALRALWDNIVKTYTKCNLTYIDDRLIAIRAIIKAFETIFDDRNIFGLWESHLPYQLVFATFDLRECQHLNPEFRHLPFNPHVPSWSWARYLATVTWAPEWTIEARPETTYVSVEEIRLRDISTPLCNLDGNVISDVADLRIRGHLLPCEVGEEGDEPNFFHAWVKVGGEKVPLDIHFDFAKEENVNVLPIFENVTSHNALQAILLVQRDTLTATFARCGNVSVYVNERFTEVFRAYLGTAPTPQHLYLV